MSPETLLTWAELGAALADPATLWLLHDPRPLWLIPALALLALGLPADRALAARGRNLAALSLRLLVLSLLLLAVAQPRIERRVPDLAVVIAEDRSASMSPARLDDARALAARIRAALPEGVPVVEVFDAPEGATDLTALLQRAVAAAPSARTRRVLLLTDGADRRGGPEGDAAARAAALAGAQGVQLYPVPPGLPAPNGAVVGLSLPDGLRRGASAEAQVVLSLTEPAQGVLTLTVAGAERARRAVDLPAGEHRLTLPFTAPSPGLHPVEAKLSLVGDAWPQDDARGGWQRVVGEPEVVLWGDGAEALAPKLVSGGLKARVSAELPAALPEGSTLFILSPALDRWPAEQHAQVADLARLGGVDLVLSGGRRGLALDEPHMEPLARALPVILPERRRREPPPLAVVYLIDRSDSMARSQKLELAISAVRSSVDMLPPEARVGVLSFSDAPVWTVPLTRAKNAAAVKEAVSALTVSGGTQIYPALEEAFTALSTTDATLKHIILLTDGVGLTRYDQHLSLMSRIQGSTVTVSTIALSPEAARKELEIVATYGKGRAWYAERAQDVPQIFLDETLNVLRRNLTEADDRARPVPGSALAGTVNWAAAPLLAGWNESKARTTAELGLSLGALNRPLLTSWRYGLGSATVFSSELGGGWGAGWLTWPSLDRWLVELVRAVRRRPPDTTITLSLRADAAAAQLTVLTTDRLGSPREGVKAEALVTGAQGATRLLLTEEAPGRYVASAPWDGALWVEARIDGVEGTPASVARGQVAPPPPLELDGPLSNPALLDELAAASGGEVLPDPTRFATAGVRERVERRGAWPWLVLAALLALLVELGVRRVRVG